MFSSLFLFPHMDLEKPCMSGIWGGLRRPYWGLILLFLTALAVSWLHVTTKTDLSTWEVTHTQTPHPPIQHQKTCSSFYLHGSVPKRKVVMSITDFGGVGDGKTSNTNAFHRAMEHLKGYGEKGGTQLNVPVGRWVTGSFNLTSNFTLYLEKGAVILGSKDPKEWPVIEPLPSYGRGRERLGGRHVSLIHGNGLDYVVITGRDNRRPRKDVVGAVVEQDFGTHKGHLLELMNSTTFSSPMSPSSTHPFGLSILFIAVIKGVTILAPLNAPNRWYRPRDSSSYVCIEDCYIESGDDLVAVKSCRWDQYGINLACPSSNIMIRRGSGTTPTCSGVGIGSEMSGGISNVLVEDLHVWDAAAGLRVKTERGRGGYITNITIVNMTMERVKIPIRFGSGSNDHPDEWWDPDALPLVRGIFIGNVTGVDIRQALVLEGLEGAPFEGICMTNVQLDGMGPPATWHCESVVGDAVGVSPMPCSQLQRNSSSSWCRHSSDFLGPITFYRDI